MQDPVNLIDINGLTAEDVRKIMEYIMKVTGMQTASFSFGTPSGASGMALPPFGHILLDKKYEGNLSYDQLRQLMRTLYHEMRHLQDGLFKSLFPEDPLQHHRIGVDAQNFMDKNWKFAKQMYCEGK